MWRRKIFLAALAGLLTGLVFLLPAAPEEKTPASAEHPPRLLLTGFAPFGGKPRNVSWDAIAPLDGKSVDGVKVHCLELPVEWGKIQEPLSKAMDAWQPQGVLCLGEGLSNTISIETVAKNEVKPNPDNARRLPGRKVVRADAPESYATALPVQKIQEGLEEKETGFRVVRSKSAGRYLCEECFFTLMHLGTMRFAAGQPHGFVHLPPYPSQSTPNQQKAHETKVRDVVLVIIRVMIQEHPDLFALPAETAAQPQ